MAEPASNVAPATVPGDLTSRLIVWAYRLLPLALLPLMLAASRDFGITWDEKSHQLYGERVWAFLIAGRDSDWFRPGHWYMYLHGGLFDAACVAVQRVLPGDIWTTRHYVNAFFGWVGIVYVGRLGRHLAGPGTGLLAMLLLALSPRYLADCMNNPKDIPFAALATAALYYLFRLRPQYPFLGWRQAAPIALAIALALNVRVGALLLLVYLGVALAALTIARRELAPRRLAATAARWAGLTLVVLLLGTAVWPWARGRPLVRPFQALVEASQWDWNHSVLFNGAKVSATALPWDYVPRWALLTTPPVVLLGALLSLWPLRRPRTPGAWPVLGLWGATLVPVAYVIASKATIYDGIRHLLFTYPPLVALAALGWTELARSPSRRVRPLAAAALVLGLLEPAAFQWRNHPNQTAYFNALIGGPRGAFGRFDIDYWGNSMFQAVEWADRLSRRSGTPLVVSGQPPHVARDDVRRFASLSYQQPERREHHLEVLLLRGPAPVVLGFATRSDVVHRVTTADGTPLSVVVRGPRFAEVEATLAPALSYERRTASPSMARFASPPPPH